MVLPIPHCRFPSAALLGLVMALLLATGCQKALPQRNLSLSYDFWYDQMEDRPFDMDSATILERRFHDRQGLLLGQHEYTRQSDGKTYVNEYIADLTWEALKVESPDRDAPYWIISHMDCELSVTSYRIDERGVRTVGESLATRNAWPIGMQPALNHPDLGNDAMLWTLYLHIYSASSPAPTIYVDLNRSVRGSYARLENYGGVSIDTTSPETRRIRSISNGLAYEWASNVVRSDLVLIAGPLGEVAIYETDPRPQSHGRDHEELRHTNFVPGSEVEVITVETTTSDGTDPLRR